MQPYTAISADEVRAARLDMNSFQIGLGNGLVIIKLGLEDAAFGPDGAKRIAADILFLAGLAERTASGWRPTEQEMREALASRPTTQQ